MFIVYLAKRVIFKCYNEHGIHICTIETSHPDRMLLVYILCANYADAIDVICYFQLKMLLKLRKRLKNRFAFIFFSLQLC